MFESRNPNTEQAEPVFNLEALAAQSVRNGIVSRLRLIESGYFTSEELLTTEINATYNEPGATRFPGDRPLSREELLQLLQDIAVQRDHEDERGMSDEDTAIELPTDSDYDDVLRSQAATKALKDFKIVSELMSTGLTEPQAVDQLLIFREDEIQFCMSSWKAAYTAAKAVGFAVPPTFEEWAIAMSQRSF
jgi:hypothetical protein